MGLQGTLIIVRTHGEAEPATESILRFKTRESSRSQVMPDHNMPSRKGPAGHLFHFISAFLHSSSSPEVTWFLPFTRGQLSAAGLEWTTEELTAGVLVLQNYWVPPGFSRSANAPS